ncbi:transglutaminase domain-containing protein [Nocardia transvalensis]|uniref:transglutaminase domain-containing protein n=1 Tax=Nocardia transvalensis TaxID=37333 RepID=UPI002B4B70CB|nr:transglutaminase domain-containing protein [Nocardia transvalensis]
MGTCRHFAVISCALLRYRGIASRVRCGFATYFQPGQGLDHWITEYWDDTEGRWVRIDSEILGQSVLEHPEDLGAGEFLSGGEAWAAFRDGRIDASTFGVYGTENWGPAEIRGNAIKDLAALNKVETLPWDEWGRMTASYNGETGRDYDELLDTIAAICSHGDTVALTELYARDELCVPAELVR